MIHMQSNREKFRALVLYILWKTGHFVDFGATKLHKVLWFAEARSFEAYGKPITGEKFIRDQHGPRSKNLKEVCNELEEEGLVESSTHRFYDFEVKRYRTLGPVETSEFSSEELILIDWWIAEIGERHTASSISRLSHDYGWEVARLGEELPPFAFLASRIRSLRSDEMQWAREEAKRLNLD